ncbi:unannotated protein [freshwater metagenome]
MIASFVAACVLGAFFLRILRRAEMAEDDRSTGPVTAH